MIEVLFGTDAPYAAERSDNCGGSMRIVSFIEKHQSDVVEKILRHCGLWKEAPPRAPPEPVHNDTVEEPALDYPAPPERYAAASGFFDRVCI